MAHLCAALWCHDKQALQGAAALQGRSWGAGDWAAVASVALPHLQLPPGHKLLLLLLLLLVTAMQAPGACAAAVHVLAASICAVMSAAAAGDAAAVARLGGRNRRPSPARKKHGSDGRPQGQRCGRLEGDCMQEQLLCLRPPGGSWLVCWCKLHPGCSRVRTCTGLLLSLFMQ
jgi:hypothetical protein